MTDLDPWGFDGEKDHRSERRSEGGDTFRDLSPTFLIIASVLGGLASCRLAARRDLRHLRHGRRRSLCRIPDCPSGLPMRRAAGAGAPQDWLHRQVAAGMGCHRACRGRRLRLSPRTHDGLAAGGGGTFARHGGLRRSQPDGARVRQRRLLHGRIPERPAGADAGRYRGHRPGSLTGRRPSWPGSMWAVFAIPYRCRPPTALRWPPWLSWTRSRSAGSPSAIRGRWCCARAAYRCWAWRSCGGSSRSRSMATG